MDPATPPDPAAHVAACGLFCTNCGAFRKGRCAGCQVRPMFKGCKTRACCVSRGIATCAACPDFAAPRDYRECPKVHNWISRLVGFVTHGDRPGALAMLRDRGLDAFVARKRESGRM